MIYITGDRGQLGTDCRKVFADIETAGADLPELDVSDRDQCRRALDAVQPETVINCAAFTAVDACETEQTAARRANADAPRWLAEWCRDHGAFLIHVSTDYVFAGDRALYRPYTESDETGPVSEYGRTKLAGELAVTETCDSYAILRTAWLYGLNGRNFLRTMLHLSRQGKALRVVNDQFGSPTWSYTLARQIRAVAEAGATGIFHATSEGCCSWYDLACRFLDLMGQPYDISPCGTEAYPTPARRPANSILENARLKELGLNLFRDWKEELASFAEEAAGSELWQG